VCWGSFLLSLDAAGGASMYLPIELSTGEKGVAGAIARSNDAARPRISVLHVLQFQGVMKDLLQAARSPLPEPSRPA
jgi:hypothetical protein